MGRVCQTHHAPVPAPKLNVVDNQTAGRIAGWAETKPRSRQRRGTPSQSLHQQGLLACLSFGPRAMIVALSLGCVVEGLKPITQEAHSYRAPRCQGGLGLWLVSMLQGLGFRVRASGLRLQMSALGALVGGRCVLSGQALGKRLARVGNAVFSLRSDRP
jgi:hypothetical protein